MTDTAHHRGALTGFRIVDLSRLAPGPYSTMLLADLGAEVIVVGGGRAGTPMQEVSRGKRFISLDLKSSAGQDALHRLVATADVVVEGFRPGVAFRLGADYERLAAMNPSLVYCSLSGYGQTGPMAAEAGHDINYLAITGMLGSMGPVDGPPVVPLNLVADFGGGSMLAAFSIVAALLERERSGLGQHLDVAMIDGVQSMMSMYYSMWGSTAMPSRGRTITDGSAPFYRAYECADGRYVAVGALEEQFFKSMWRNLGLGEPPPQYPRSKWPAIERALTDRFLEQPRDIWAARLAGTDACVTAVLDPDEVHTHPQVVARHGQRAVAEVPAIPGLSRTPSVARKFDTTDVTEEVLTDLGLSPAEIQQAKDLSIPRGMTGWPDM